MGTRLGTLDSLIIWRTGVLFPLGAKKKTRSLFGGATIVLDEDMCIGLQKEANVRVSDPVTYRPGISTLSAILHLTSPL